MALTITLNGDTETFTSFHWLAQRAQAYAGAGVSAVCVVGKKTLTLQEVVAEYERRAVAAWDKKNQTHRRASVLYGSSTSRVTKWVRR